MGEQARRERCDRTKSEELIVNVLLVSYIGISSPERCENMGSANTTIFESFVTLTGALQERGGNTRVP